LTKYALPKQESDVAFTFKKKFNTSDEGIRKHSLEDLSPKNEKEGEKPHIGKIEEAPKWLIDNHYILTGYRINFSTVKLTFRSLFMCHNESTNIWSHLLGVIMFVGFIFYIVFCIGGMTLTKPLDLVIDNFEINDPGKCEMPFNLCSDCIPIWVKEVENLNPEVFTDKLSSMLQYTRNSQLYDSADVYLHEVIER
jgi:hypothetical protein